MHAFSISDSYNFESKASRGNMHTLHCSWFSSMRTARRASWKVKALMASSSSKRWHWRLPKTICCSACLGCPTLHGEGNFSGPILRAPQMNGYNGSSNLARIAETITASSFIEGMVLLVMTSRCINEPPSCVGIELFVEAGKLSTASKVSKIDNH